MPKITVIVPVYNCEKYIRRCLDSILVQTYKDFMILIIDDGSTDGTRKILEDYEKLFPKKVKIIYQENCGAAKTRNRAMKLAKSEWIAFVDCDDFVARDYLKKMLPDKNEEIVLSGYRRPNIDGKVVAEVKLKNANWAKFVIPAPWAKIYRRDFLLNNKIEFLDNDIGEDVYFNLVAMLMAKKVRILEYVGYNWFFNDKSVSNTKQKKFRNVNVFKLLDSCYNEITTRGLLKDNYAVLELFFYRYIVWFLLFACKGQSWAEISGEYDELFTWLAGKFPNYKKAKLLNGELPGEIENTRRIYRLFMFFHKIKCGKLLVWVYAKI